MHKLILLAVALAVALPARAAEPANQPGQTAQPVAKKKRRIAVLDVRALGSVDPKTFEGLASLIASEISNRAPSVQTIGSSDVRSMIGYEREKQLLGCTESNCLAEIGGAMGVDFLLTTEGSKVGGTWLLSMALLDVAKAQPVKRLTRRIETENRLVEEAVEGVKEILVALGVEVAEKEKSEGIPAVTWEPRGKTLSWILVAGGGAAVLGGVGAVGFAFAERNKYVRDRDSGVVVMSRADAVRSNWSAIAGYALMGVGAAATLWGALRLTLPESHAAVTLAPGPGSVHASVEFGLP